MIAERAYHFVCENDAPIEHIKEALFQCQKYIGQVEDNIKAQLAAQAAASAAPPPPCEPCEVDCADKVVEIPIDQPPEA